MSGIYMQPIQFTGNQADMLRHFEVNLVPAPKIISILELYTCDRITTGSHGTYGKPIAQTDLLQENLYKWCNSVLWVQCVLMHTILCSEFLWVGSAFVD